MPLKPGIVIDSVCKGIDILVYTLIGSVEGRSTSG